MSAHILVYMAVALASVSLVVTWLVSASVFFNQPTPPLRGELLPPISVLKPLKGVDDGLWENLVALAEQDYPNFEILLGAADRDDPALALARRFQREYDHLDIRVIVCERNLGFNPKVSNLAQLTEHARHDLVLVSDSNVRPAPSYLRASATEIMRPGVGLVSNVLVGTGERSMGAFFENLHLNSFVVAAICGGDRVGHPCVIGKSMLLRRSDLEAMGGWLSVADILAEDYVLGNRFHNAGFEVALSGHTLPTVNVDWSFRRFANRHIRWAQLRRHISPLAFVGEPLLNPVAFAAAALLLMAPADMLGTPLSAAMVAIVGAKLLLDDLLYRRLRGQSIGLEGAILAPVKDVVVFGLWVIASVKRTVSWRGNRMLIEKGSRVCPLDEPASREPATLDEAA